MKKYLLFLSFLLVQSAFSQNNSHENVQQTIAQFFKAFHNRDSVGLKTNVTNNIVLQTIGNTKDGKPLLKNENFNDFLKSIASIPDSVKFEEKITSYSIKIDGPMANVWTEYEFWLNNKFHHCGVNSFQLFNNGEGWKIIYLIDTRREEDCD